MMVCNANRVPSHCTHIRVCRVFYHTQTTCGSQALCTWREVINEKYLSPRCHQNHLHCGIIWKCEYLLLLSDKVFLLPLADCFISLEHFHKAIAKTLTIQISCFCFFLWLLILLITHSNGLSACVSVCVTVKSISVFWFLFCFFFFVLSKLLLSFLFDRTNKKQKIEIKYYLL